MTVAPDIVASMSRGWNRDPSGLVLGTERSGMSAALWTHDADDVQEVDAPRDDHHHTITLVLSRLYAEVDHDGRRVIQGSVVPGDVTIVPAGVSPRAMHRGRWRIMHFYLPSKILNGLVEESGTSIAAVEVVDPRCSRDPAIERIGREIKAEMREGGPLSRLRVDALAQDLGIHLLRQHSSLQGTRPLSNLDRGRLAPWQVKRATEFLMANLEEDVSLQALADTVRLSAFHFARAFKASLGSPPQRWLMERRVDRARELLAATQMGLAEIALACGFASQSHFTTAFKRHTGVTPGVWRAFVRN